MSGGEPGEMAPKSLQVVVIPKFDVHIHTSTLTTKELKQVIKEFCISADLRPRLPSPDLTMDKLPLIVIGIYVEQLDQGRMMIPFSTFLLAVIKQFQVHISQQVPMGVNRVTMFEVRYRRAIPNAMSWRHIDTDVRDDFPVNYNEGDVDRLAEHIILLLITMDDFLKLPDWNETVRSVEKPDAKIATAREKKDKQTLAKAQAKRAGEASSSAPKPLNEATGSRKKDAEKTVIDLSEHTRSSFLLSYVIAFGWWVLTILFCLCTTHSFHSIHDEDNDEDADEHWFVPEWGLRDDLCICSYRACKELISYLATPAEDKVLSSLTNYEVEELNRLRNDYQREMQKNEGLLKNFVLIENAHLQCSDKERELSDMLKDMEWERDELRQRASDQVERIKNLEEDLDPKSQQLSDKVANSYLLPSGDLMNVFPDVPIDTAANKVGASTQDGDASSSQPKPQDTAPPNVVAQA
ncbi:hypothetical protein Tco_1362468 [Tanacetum coccineum]